MKNDRQEKRRSWIHFSLLSSMFLLTLIIGVFIFSTGDSKFQSFTSAKTKAEIAYVPDVLLSESPTKFKDIQIITETSDHTTMPYAVNYPKTNFQNINKEISQFIASSKENYVEAVRLYTNANSKVDVVGEFLMTADISLHNNNYYSVILKNNTKINKANYDTTYQTYLFNKNSGELISFSQLLNNKVENLEVFAKHVRNQISTNYSKYFDKDKMTQLTEPKWENFNRFGVSDSHLVIYYNYNEIADPLAGTPNVIIPISFLNPILAEPFKSTTVSKETIIPVKPPTGKRIALTFDDGPHEKVTPQILKLLEKYDAKATFFVVGNRIAKNTKLVQEIHNSGHEIGNHTWNHPNLTSISSKQVSSQLKSTNDAIFTAIGEYPTVFRPPYGAKNKQVTDLVALPVVMWTIDTLDWKYRDQSKLLPMVKKSIHNNAIVLMHDIHQPTADGLESVLAYLQNEGYECVTVSELLENK
ncbi:polysaccharide deacetylase family protein [Lysinibacillus antri]|uniref:1,4-beta-xylanase n=1 Tax=Lysinibacillus antri TaxID=2498145 RepID=A0A3S0P5Q6_9BACI|nr:polysaccharide deacetylase family protein [Lysinibacillus antri]RUL52055.1 1,4-beta-xylanase [Lysinibacillus antri]